MSYPTEHGPNHKQESETLTDQQPSLLKDVALMQQVLMDTLIDKINEVTSYDTITTIDLRTEVDVRILVSGNDISISSCFTLEPKAKS